MIMMNNLAAEYKIHENIIRHQLKVAEFQRQMDLERFLIMKLKSNNSNTNMANPSFYIPQNRNYCSMCDVHFNGPFAKHRQLDGHMVYDIN